VIQKSNEGNVKEIYSLYPGPSFEIRFDSLDLFGSFLGQSKNEQKEIWIKQWNKP